MTRPRGRLLLCFLKNRHWFRGRLRRPAVTFDTSIEDQRRSVEEGAQRFGKIPEGAAITPAEHAAPAAEWVWPSRSPSSRGSVIAAFEDHQ